MDLRMVVKVRKNYLIDMQKEYKEEVKILSAYKKQSKNNRKNLRLFFCVGERIILVAR